MNILFCSNRTEEMNNSQLTELEEDIQQQLARTEERVRDNVSMIPAVLEWMMAPVIYTCMSIEREMYQIR